MRRSAQIGPARINRRSALTMTAGTALALTTTNVFADRPGPTGKIAFVRGYYANGYGKILILDLQTKLLRSLQNPKTNAKEDRPNWSPDGKKLAFGLNRRIATCNADGSNVRFLTHPRLRAEDPAWSPNGDVIAFHGWNANQTTSKIYLIDADGSGIQKVTSHEGYHWGPKWTRDGYRIVFESLLHGDNRDVYSMYLGGQNLVKLTDDEAIDWHPACSPAEDRIALATNRYGSFEIAVMNDDGKGIRNLTKHDTRDVEPAWSPDGNWIAFTRTPNKNDDPRATMDVWIMRSDGSDQQNLTNSPEGIDNWGPAWTG